MIHISRGWTRKPSYFVKGRNKSNYLLLNERSGDANMSNGERGSFVSSVADPVWTSSGLDFIKTDESYLDIPYSASLSEFTIIFKGFSSSATLSWTDYVTLVTTSGELVLESRGNTVTGAIALFNLSSISGITEIGSTSNAQDVRGTKITVTYTVSAKKNEAKIYVNNIQQSTTVAHNPVDSITGIAIGNRPSDITTRGMEGSIESVLILQRSISRSEVKEYTDNIYKDLDDYNTDYHVILPASTPAGIAVLRRRLITRAVS